ncbi:hypothetical protein P3W33_07765 [Luteibacter sp. PPL552]
MTVSPTEFSDLSADAQACLSRAALAHTAMEHAAQGVTLAADALRRYAKFSRPGQPSAHIVQLRQNQAAARMASVQARQAFAVAAQAFFRASGSTLPPGVTLESFVRMWIHHAS